MHYTIYGRESGKEAKKEEELNLLNEYFYVTLFLEENASAVLPEELCVDTEFLEVYTPYGMEPYPEGTAIIEKGEGGTVITNKGGELGMVAKLRICGECLAGQKTKKLRSLLLTPCGSEIFPAAYGKGHNAVLYGGENGAEFAVCSLDGDLYVKEGEVLLAQNTEKITSVLRYSENFLVFSPHYIRKMILTEAEDGSFNASMQNFKYDIGCDVPKSAVCADDKIIYANSHAGIFYIDRFGFTQKDMSRHVSANIEAGENGFFALSESDAKGAQAVVCGGKYFLCAGDFFYVWDFAHGLPSGTEKASEEQRLRWFMYSGIPCFKMLGADGENFYFLTSAGEFASLCHGTSLSSGAESYFRSRKYNLAQFGKACVWKLSLSLASKSECTVRLYFDGEEGNSKYTVSPDSEASTLCIVRPEARACRSFAFSIHSFGAMRLDGVKIEFLPK
jgi:hypothetical protein